MKGRRRFRGVSGGLERLWSCCIWAETVSKSALSEHDMITGQPKLVQRQAGNGRHRR